MRVIDVLRPVGAQLSDGISNDGGFNPPDQLLLLPEQVPLLEGDVLGKHVEVKEHHRRGCIKELFFELKN